VHQIDNLGLIACGGGEKGGSSVKRGSVRPLAFVPLIFYEIIRLECSISRTNGFVLDERESEFFRVSKSWPTDEM
jgi:hypothetical protein